MASAAATPDPRTAFIAAATWHGELEPAQRILAEHPELAGSDIHTAAILGDAAAVKRFLADDPTSVHAKSPPYGGDALNYLGLSKYLRLDPARTPGFLEAATALLDAGADPNTGFWTTGKHPERETALYGAAGVAHHPELTRLLLERGADPTDVEVVYHSPEGWDSRAMQAVVETGRLSEDELILMLIRKHDWHDEEGVAWLLARGLDLNRQRGKDWSPLHHAIQRDNSLEIVRMLLDHGADPQQRAAGMSAIERATRLGRSDILAELERRKVPLNLEGVDRLIAACAQSDQAAIGTLLAAEPGLLSELLAQGATLLGRFTLTDNRPGVERLLELGVPVDAAWEGDGYFGIPGGSTALQVAAWMLLPDLVRYLLARGAAVNSSNADGHSPLALAVVASVDSYWTERRTPVIIETLLGAGASLEGVPYPSGYPEADELLRRSSERTRTTESRQ